MQKIKRYRFIVKGLACDVFAPADAAMAPPEKKAAMYLYGFPGSIGENEITRALLGEGFVVFQPHYPGTYDSSGDFAPESAIEMLTPLSEALARGEVENVKDLRPSPVPKAISLLVGHSFGSFVALRGARHLPALEVLILLGPAIAYSPGPSGCGLVEDGTEHVSYVKRSRPYTYRLALDGLWTDLYSGKFDRAISPYIPTPYLHPSLKAVRGRVGSQDSYFNHPQLFERFEAIVREQLDSVPVVEVREVEGVGHGPAGLLTPADLKVS